MWKQPQDTPPPPPKDKQLLVNNRGRVVEVDKEEVAKLLGDGRFYQPPPEAKMGDYIPVFDQGLTATGQTVKLPEVHNDDDFGDWLPVVEV